jgi:hypothetical protein
MMTVRPGLTGYFLESDIALIVEKITRKGNSNGNTKEN